MSDDLVERLQNPRPISMFLTKADQVKNWAKQMKAAADRIEELEAKLAQQDDLVQAANRLAEYLNGDYIYMERVHHLAALIRKGKSDGVET